MTPEQEAIKWLRSRPPVIQDLLRRFPPQAKVKTKPGVRLIVPAPGIVGVVNSYFEDGMVSVIAPMPKALTSPITKATLQEGEMVTGEVSDPDEKLEVIGYAPGPNGALMDPDWIMEMLSD